MVTLPTSPEYYRKTPTRIAYKIQKFISHSLDAGRGPAELSEGSLLVTDFIVSFTWSNGWGVLCSSLWGINPILRVPALWFKHLKSPMCQHLSCLVTRISMYEFWGDKKIRTWQLSFYLFHRRNHFLSHLFPEMVTTIWSFLCAILLSGYHSSSRKCLSLQ